MTGDDTDDETGAVVELSRRRILGGVVTIGGAAAAAGAGTFALFSDEESSSGNTVNAGTLTLQSTSGSFSVSDIKPTDRVPSTGSNSITTTYDGSISGVEVDFEISVAEPGSEPQEPSEFSGNQSASAFAGQLNLVTADLKKNGSSVNDLTTSNNTLADITGSLDNQTTVSNGDSLSFDLAMTLAQGTGNQFQADGVDITVKFIAEQVSAD